MKIERKICSAFVAIALMGVAPMALAQDQNAQPVETVQVETVKTAEVGDIKQKRPASWQGKKVALRGRDVVSFHQDSGPVKGSKKYVAQWDDTKWYFSNEKNRDAFKTDPGKYIPEFGGYCPVALAQGKAKVGRTNQFTKVDDKLYLNYNSDLRGKFATKPDDYIVKAQINW